MNTASGSDSVPKKEPELSTSSAVSNPAPTVIPQEISSQAGSATYRSDAGPGTLRPDADPSTSRTHASTKAVQGTSRIYTTTKAGQGTSRTRATTTAGQGASRTAVSTKASQGASRTASSTKAGQGASRTDASTKAGQGASRTDASTKAGQSSCRTHASPKAGQSTSTTRTSPKAGPSTSGTHSILKAGPGTSAAVETSLMPRNVQRIHHAHFKWTIENFSLFPDVNDEYCLSPTFALHDTFWELAFHPKAMVHGVERVALNLIRRKVQRGPSTVTVSYRFGLESPDYKVWFKQKLSVTFGKGDCYGFHESLLSNLEDFLSGDHQNNNDSISVLCELYFSYEKCVYLPERRRPIDVQLQTNLVSLYKSEILSDTLIECSSSEYRKRVHKAILYARSRTLASLLENGESFVRVDSSCPTLNFALVYMYTGSVYRVVKKCTFGIGSYELAEHLSLDQLRDLLEPNSIALKSRIVDEKTTIAWTLLQFHITDLFQGNLFSESFREPVTKYCIQLIVKKMTDHEHIDIAVSVSGLENALRRNIEVFLWNKGVTPFEKVPAVYYDVIFERSELRFTARFSVIDVLHCSFFDDNRLGVHFSFKRLWLRHLENLESRRLNRPSDDLEEDWLEGLSKDLLELWKSGKLSDASLLVQPDWTFQAHQCILAARSNHFVRLLSDHYHKNRILVGNEIEPQVLFLVLAFMYSGKFLTLPSPHKTTKMDFLHVYEYAEMFGLKQLKIHVQAHLLSHLDPEIAPRMLISAQRFKNQDMMNQCLDYIKESSGHDGSI